MLDFIAQHADYFFAVPQAIMTASVLPTIWDQLKTKTCSIPLTTSGPLSACLAVLALTMFATNCPLATVVSGIAAVLWALTGVQRIWYNRGRGAHESKHKAHHADPELRAQPSRLRSPASDRSENSWG